MSCRILHVVIPNCRKWESEVLGCSPLAYCPREGSWRSESWLKSWKLSVGPSVRLPQTVRLSGLFWRKESRLKTMKLDYKYFGTICMGLISSLSCLRAIFFSRIVTCSISFLWRTAGPSEDLIQLARGLCETPTKTVRHPIFIVYGIPRYTCACMAAGTQTILYFNL